MDLPIGEIDILQSQYGLPVVATCIVIKLQQHICAILNQLQIAGFEGIGAILVAVERT